GLSRCRGQITHVLLTRSPLSPRPKPWFSLDLHVLSAPPAFVLSQDQTLHEVGLPPKRQIDHFELALKVRSIPKNGGGVLSFKPPRLNEPDVLVQTDPGSRRDRTAEFSKTFATWPARK